MHVGATGMVASYPHLGAELDKRHKEDYVPKCNKDTGAKKQLQKWTRGHFFIVRGGGHIDM